LLFSIMRITIATAIMAARPDCARERT